MANKKVQQLTAVENEQNDKSKINWKVRIANKTFWLSLIPAALLLVQVVASVFGFTRRAGEQAAGSGQRPVCGTGDSRSSYRPDHRRCGRFPKGYDLQGTLSGW